MLKNKMASIFTKSIILTASVASPASLLVNCSNNENYLPKVESVWLQTPTFFKTAIYESEGYLEPKYEIFNPDPYLQDHSKIKMYHFNNSSVGYIPINDWVNNTMHFSRHYGNSYVDFVSYTRSDKTVIINPNAFQGYKGTCVIDYKKQTITFNNYDVYKVVTNYDVPFFQWHEGAESYLMDFQDVKFTPGKSITIDCKKYNIPLYFYENQGFIPYEIYVNFINPKPKYKMFYNGTNFFELPINFNEYGRRFLNPIIQQSTSMKNYEYLEYTYNLLNMILDYGFGVRQRTTVRKQKQIQLLPNGACKETEPFKHDFVSLENLLLDITLEHFLSWYCDDGGLSKKKTDSITSSMPIPNDSTLDELDMQSVFQELKGDKALNFTSALHYWNSPDRGRFKKSIDEINQKHIFSFYDEKTPKKTSQSLGDENKNVGFLSADLFALPDPKTFSFEESVRDRVLPEYVDGGNYGYDTIRWILYANEVLHKDDHVKDLVLDIGMDRTTGSPVACILASWLCGGAKYKFYNPLTEAFCEFTIRADINGDNVFDSNDYLPDDINLWVLSSSSAYGDSNNVLCTLQQNMKPSRFNIIGDRSVGGSYFPIIFNMGAGISISLASNNEMVTLDSDKSNIKSFDDGITIDKTDENWYWPNWNENGALIGGNITKLTNYQNIADAIKQASNK